MDAQDKFEVNECGEIEVTANGTVALNSVIEGVRTIWLRGFTLNSAPMGATYPKHPLTLVNCQRADIRHPRRISTSAVNGFPLQLDGANTRVRFERPRLFALVTGRELRDIPILVTGPAGNVVDDTGSPLYSYLMLDLVFSSCPMQRDPAILDYYGMRHTEFARGGQ